MAWLAARSKGVRQRENTCFSMAGVREHGRFYQQRAHPLPWRTRPRLAMSSGEAFLDAHLCGPFKDQGANLPIVDDFCGLVHPWS
mmetsp:Transcript_9611/g.29258  ORF Transcript_9611/g.29258 Transcript_9611/m.29258 type:complete len:85 (+) Transcript_9611:2440-2694(+)|eukprot:scaffold255863_cov40-Tisochrysis_lutea.AAC.3